MRMVTPVWCNSGTYNLGVTHSWIKRKESIPDALNLARCLLLDSATSSSAAPHHCHWLQGAQREGSSRCFGSPHLFDQCPPPVLITKGFYSPMLYILNWSIRNPELRKVTQKVQDSYIGRLRTLTDSPLLSAAHCIWKKIKCNSSSL